MSLSINTSHSTAFGGKMLSARDQSRAGGLVARRRGGGAIPSLPCLLSVSVDLAPEGQFNPRSRKKRKTALKQVCRKSLLLQARNRRKKLPGPLRVGGCLCLQDICTGRGAAAEPAGCS
ncbi:hypothetical protein CapIbe_022911 [Capra ibex]